MRSVAFDGDEMRRRVEIELQTYAASYEAPDHALFVGSPWSKDRIACEIEAALACLVDPYLVSYQSGDDLIEPHRRLVGTRSAYVVAEDWPYCLLFDVDAGDYVLGHRPSPSARISAWGLRGDAASTFLAR